MIKIQVTYQKDEFESLIAKGHADSAPKGKDLVCAAVSAVLEGGVQALTDGDGSYRLRMREGNLELTRLIPKMSEHDEVVIETIITQLESIAQVSNDYVQLERKQK